MKEIVQYAFDEMPVANDLGVEVKKLGNEQPPRLLSEPHRTDFYYVVYLSEGYLRLKVDFTDVTLRENDMIVVAKGQVCQFDFSSPYKGYALLFTSKFFAETEFDASFLYKSKALSPMFQRHPLKTNKKTDNFFALVEREINGPKDAFQAPITRSYLRILLLYMDRYIDAENVGGVNELANKFCHSVEEHYKTSQSVSDYQKELGVTSKKLTGAVMEAIGMTPKSYVDSRRVLEAKRLLLYSELSVKEISFELGFDEATNFNKFFKKHTGASPAEFRKSERI